MTIIFVPTERCNFKCVGCFEDRKLHTDPPSEYDFEKMKQALNEVWEGPYKGSSLCLHGGEATLIPRRELERCLEHLHGIQGAVSIVTNGSNIDDYTIALFKRYNVYVALSIDGPPEFNIHRGPNPSDASVTRDYNNKLLRIMEHLCNEGVPTSILCILHKDNAGTRQHLTKLGEWALQLKRLGIKGGRMNLMYCNPSAKHIELSPDEAFEAWKYLYELNKKEQLDWNPFREMTRNLLGFKLSPCTFCRCDPFNTHTLSILPDGTVGNCDRTFARGLYPRSKSGNKSGRYQALEQTQCKNCKYWDICGGGCPEEGFNDDWRNKSRFCETTYQMYQYIENDLRGIIPRIKLMTDHDFTGDPFSQVGTKTQPPLRRGPPFTDADMDHGDMGHGDSNHGDSNHGDVVHGDQGHGDSNHGDMGHGDLPHGDSHHGDSQDW